MDTPFPAIRTKRQRSHALRIVRERVNGKYRFKIAGYYVDGKRIRKYFETREAAETFIEAEQIRRENLGKEPLTLTALSPKMRCAHRTF